METCFLGGPEDWQKTLFTEAFKHIVIPSEKFIKDRICIGSGNGKLNVIEAPPGSGKTHAFTYDLLWRGLTLFRKFKNSPNMIAMFTSPDTSVNENIDAEMQGLEAELFWSPSSVPGLRIDAQVSFLETEVASTVVSTVDAIVVAMKP